VLWLYADGTTHVEVLIKSDFFEHHFYPLTLFIFPWQEPKLEVIDSGCIILCQKCCADESAIVMPYERFCFCCTNRVGCCDNNCGTCGPITGNPKVFSAFLPQPKNAKAFVEAAQAVHKQKAGLTV